MPLRDHFRPPLGERRSWDGLHGGWPMMIVEGLNRRLPDRYVAEPRIHLGSSIEVDVATDDEGESEPSRRRAGRRSWDLDGDLVLVAADPGRGDRPAECGRVRGPGLRRQVGTSDRGCDRDREPRQQGSAREPSCVRRQMCRLDPGTGLRRDRGSGHDTHFSNCMVAAWDSWARPTRCWPPSLRPSTLSRAAGRGPATPGNSRPGGIPSARPPVADAAALARRGPGRPARAGPQLRGDAPHPPHPIGGMGSLGGNGWTSFSSSLSRRDGGNGVTSFSSSLSRRDGAGVTPRA